MPGKYKHVFMLVWSKQELYDRNHNGKFEREKYIMSL